MWASCSASSSDFIAWRNSKARASAWRMSGASSSGMGDAHGQKAPSTREPRSISVCRGQKEPLETMAELKPILLVEDNPKDVELTLAALEQSQLANAVIVVRDGAEALDFLYRKKAHESRN